MGSSQQITILVTLINKGEVATLPLQINVDWTAELRAKTLDKPHFIRKRGITCNLAKPLKHAESVSSSVDVFLAANVLHV